MNSFFSSHIVFSCLLVWISFASLVTFVFFVFDKLKSLRKNQDRISEKTLLWLCVWGGSLGALGGIYILRHKSKHFYFPLIAWQSVILQILILSVSYVHFI